MKYLFVLLLAGCSTHYIQDGKTSADFEMDLEYCERGYAAMHDRIAAEIRIDRCLKSRGWRPE